MTRAERQRLRRALEALAARLETRSHPLTDDFDDTPVGAALHVELGTALPKLTAARALVGIAAADDCAGDACVNPWARGGSDEARRARYVAWPLSGAALLRFTDAHRAAAAAATLRARAAERDSRIALVVADDGVDPELARELVAVRAAAARAAELLARSGDDERARALLDEVAHATAPTLPSWLALDARELLVVPRLGTIAALDAFAAEVAAHAPDARFVARPRALD